MSPDSSDTSGTADAGDLDAHFQSVYEELRRLARQRLGAAAAGRTLQATALVHEAYVRLMANSRLSVRDRSHFFALAARAMRFILVDRARKRLAAKRLHVEEARSAADIPAGQPLDAVEILSLDEALSRLHLQDPRKADVVMYRYFAGLSIEETAQLMNISPASVKREWHFARAWLLRCMRDAETGHPDG